MPEACRQARGEAGLKVTLTSFPVAASSWERACLLCCPETRRDWSTVKRQENTCQTTEREDTSPARKELAHDDTATHWVSLSKYLFPILCSFLDSVYVMRWISLVMSERTSDEGGLKRVMSDPKILCGRSGFEPQGGLYWFSECVPRSSNVITAWELARNANLGSRMPQSCWIRNSGETRAISLWSWNTSEFANPCFR